MSESEPATPQRGGRQGHEFRVGEWVVRPELGRVAHAETGARDTGLEPKVMEVLVCLAARPGEVISRADLMDLVWGDAHVGEDPLNRAISRLRKLFGDDARQPRYIETIHKRGYRLIAPVRPEIPPSSAWRPSRRAGLVALGTTVLAGGALWLTRAVPAQEPRTTTPTARVSPVTTLPGREHMPALSPDGSRVAFARLGPGTTGLDVYVTQPDAARPVRLTTDPANDDQPSWSPDGRTIAFVRATQDSCDVFVVPAIGGPERPLYRCKAVIGLDFAPDGGSLVLADRTDDGYGYGLRVVSLESGAARTLTRPPAGSLDTIPKISPDGRQVAFRRTLDRAVQEIFLIPFEGGAPRQFTFDREDIGGLDWTPSGGALVVSSNRGGTFGLWRLPLVGGGAEWLGYEDAYLPSVVPGAMVFERRSGDVDIWRVPLPGQPGTKPAVEAEPARWIASTQPDLEPRYSPGGSRIAFVSQRSGSHELWVTDAEGAEPTRLTFLGGPAAGWLPSVTHPRWSPDGEEIAFAARIDDRFALHVVAATGGMPRRVEGTRGNDRAPCWASDQELWFVSDHSGDWSLSRVGIDGGEPVAVKAPGILPYLECPGADLLYFADRRGQVRGLRAAHGASEEAQSIGPNGIVGDWGAGDQGMYGFVQRAGEGFALGLWSWGTDDARWLVPLHEKRPAGGLTTSAGGLSISPDRRWALYASVEGDESDIVIVRGLVVDPQ